MPRRATKSLPPEDRPRERCLRLGPEALSETELVAILLGTGGAGEDVMEVARHAVSAFQSLDRLALASPKEITALPGFGPARAAALKAAFELGRRLSAERPLTERLGNFRSALALVGPWLVGLKQETFVVLCLDNKQRLLRKEVVSRGIVNSSLVHPREVFAPAIREGAAGILVAHNHPSGDPDPSDEDLAVTKRLEEAGRLLGIRLMDHIIVARSRSISLREMGAVAPA